MHMSKKERLQAVISGETPDRTPIGFWRHWPGDDQSPDSLAAVTLRFQNQYDLDSLNYQFHQYFVSMIMGLSMLIKTI